jgi:hypothetical protein
LGEIKRRDETSTCQKKRCTDACWPEKTLRANEGPLGSKKKGRRNKSSTFAFGEERWTHTCRPKKAVAVDEGSLGGATKSSGVDAPTAALSIVIDQYNRNLRLADSFRF